MSAYYHSPLPPSSSPVVSFFSRRPFRFPYFRKFELSDLWGDRKGEDDPHAGTEKGEGGSIDGIAKKSLILFWRYLCRILDKKAIRFLLVMQAAANFLAESAVLRRHKTALLFSLSQ